MAAHKLFKSPDAKLRLAEEKVGFGTWTWDLETSEVVWSPGLCRILGVDPHTVVPTIELYQSLCHPEDQLDFNDAIGIVSSRKLESRIFRVIRPDGAQRYLHSKAEPHFERNGALVMLMGVIRDVTEEQALMGEFASQREVAKVLTHLVEGTVWRAYPDGKLIETTHWMKLTGQTPHEARDWDRLAAIHPDDRGAFRQAWRDAIVGRTALDVTIRVRLVDGSFQRRRCRAHPLLDGTGSIQQWIGHSTTIQERSERPAQEALLTSAQIRAARALLDWTGPELADRAAVSFSTIRRMEQDASSVRQESLVRVRSTFASAGITFSVDARGKRTLSFFEDDEARPFEDDAGALKRHG